MAPFISYWTKKDGEGGILSRKIGFQISSPCSRFKIWDEADVTTTPIRAQEVIITGAATNWDNMG
jgi:hypothetical protein